MLTDLARAQGIADCLTKFAVINAATMAAMGKNYSTFDPAADAIHRRRLENNKATLAPDFDKQVAAHDAISRTMPGEVTPSGVSAGDTRWGPAPGKFRAPVPGAPLPYAPPPGQRPTITNPGFAAPTTQQPNAPKELGYHPPPVLGVPSGPNAGTGVGRDPRLLHRVKVR